MTRRAENRLLLAAARIGPPDAILAVPRPLDWAYLHAAAGHQGVAPLLHDWARARDGIAGAAALAARLAPAYWGSHFANRARGGELARVLRVAADAGVPVMPLKGAILAWCYYPTAALRPMSDLDLLVPAEGMGTLAAALAELGYAEDRDKPRLLDEARRDDRHRERGFTATPGRTPIRIECRAEPLDPMLWGLTEVDPAFAARLRRQVERMWARAARDTFEGAPFARIAPEDLVLHVASHLATRHGEFRLLWLHDLALIAAAHAGALDWDDVAAMARGLRLGAPVLAALEAAGRWAGAPIPLPALRPLLLRAPVGLPTPASVEHAILTRDLGTLPDADLATPPPELGRKALSLLRLGGPRSWARAARWALAPGGDYMVGWRGRTSAFAGSGYARAVALRLLVLALRALATTTRRLRLPVLAPFLERLLARVRDAARLAPFAISWPKQGGRGDL